MRSFTLPAGLKYSSFAMIRAEGSCLLPYWFSSSRSVADQIGQSVWQFFPSYCFFMSFIRWAAWAAETLQSQNCYFHTINRFPPEKIRPGFVFLTGQRSAIVSGSPPSGGRGGIVNQKVVPFPSSDSTPDFASQFVDDRFTDRKPQSRSLNESVELGEPFRIREEDFPGRCPCPFRDETTDETVGAFVSHRDRFLPSVNLQALLRKFVHDLREPVLSEWVTNVRSGRLQIQLHRSFESEMVNLLQVPEQFVHVDVRVDETRAVRPSIFDRSWISLINCSKQFVVRFDNFAEFGDLFGIPRLGDQVRKTDRSRFSGVRIS